MINLKRITVNGEIQLENKEQVDNIRKLLSNILQVESACINCIYEEVPSEETHTPA